MRYGMNDREKELWGRARKTKSDCSSNSMRGRFGSPIFGPEHFQAHSLRPLQTRPPPPPRIELSVQISILTANLPANSPPYSYSSPASSFHRQLPSQCRFFPVLQVFPSATLGLNFSTSLIIRYSLKYFENNLSRGKISGSFPLLLIFTI